MQCLFSPLAEADLEEIGDYIARDNPTRTITFIQEIRELCHNITAVPEGYPLRSELGENIRMAPFRRYLIFYTAGIESVRIERILHGARDISNLLDAY
jgi:toxin ParE1/3/4